VQKPGGENTAKGTRERKNGLECSRGRKMKGQEKEKKRRELVNQVNREEGRPKESSIGKGRKFPGNRDQKGGGAKWTWGGKQRKTGGN